MNHKHSIYILVFIVVGIALAGISAAIWGEAMVSVAWLGELFLMALRMMIIPLIFAAVISGVAALGDVRKLGRIGGMTVAYYMLTSGLAVLVGLIVVNVLQPGAGIELGDGTIPERVLEKQAMGWEGILFSMFTPNLVLSAAETQILPLIVFAIAFGAALTTIGKTGEHVIEFFNGVNEAIMRLVIWLMYFAPIGIFGLVAGRLGKAEAEGGLMAQIEGVGMHVFTVLSGLGIHFVILLAVMFFVAGRGWDYLVNNLRPLLTAFGTASSSATLPLTMEVSRENGNDPRATRFVIPLGATINMNGTALYEACAAMFIAQAYGIDLSLGAQGIIFVTATLAAIGAAGIPEAGLVTMVIVLNAVGLPLEGIGLLLTVDWFLDRFRTSVNVWGDAVGAAVIDRAIVSTGSDVPASETGRT